MDCIRGLIGLISSDITVWGSPTKDEYTVSTLGRFVWDLVGPELLGDMRMDPQNASVDLLSELEKAYESALATIPAELAGFLGNRIVPVFTSYDGRLGEVATTGIVAVPGNLAGFALPTRRLDGASITIRKLGLILNTSCTDLIISVKRYAGPLPLAPVSSLQSFLGSDYLKNQPGELLRQWSIDVTGYDTKTYTITPLVLPLDGSIYTISYSLPAGIFPMNNQLTCQCGGKDARIDKLLMSRFAALNGNQAHGLLLDVVASCDYSGVVCDLLANNQYSAAIGYLLYYKTALILLDTALGGGLSPAIQIKKEDLLTKKQEWTSEMATYLTWMTTNWRADLLPAQRCYVCDTANAPYRGIIRL